MTPQRAASDPSAHITQLAKALNHPVRVRILVHLRAHDTASPSELAHALGADLGTLSYHFKRLETLGFVRIVRRIPRRGAIEHRYALVGGVLGDFPLAA
jgi:DNA-binding transcriptional ArsR family regulator